MFSMAKINKIWVVQHRRTGCFSDEKMNGSTLKAHWEIISSNFNTAVFN